VCCCQGSASTNTHYGLALARSGGLPTALVDCAAAVVDVLQRKQVRPQLIVHSPRHARADSPRAYCAAQACASATAAEGQSVFSLSQRLLGLAQSTDDEEGAREALRKLRASALLLADADEQERRG
jgi:hypothetical protein